MDNMVYAGPSGPKVRSDCHVGIEIRESGGIKIDLKSKVEIMYGKSIRTLAEDVLTTMGIENAYLHIEDWGALPFVLAARIETAVKRAVEDITKDYLLPMSSKCTYDTSYDRFRRSRLYLPGNQPKFMLNAGIYGADAIILDLEDSVPPAEKDAARILVRNALRAVDFYGAERMVRINQLPMGLEDLKTVVSHNVHVILIPKCESAEQVLEIERHINEIKKEANIDREIYLMPIIESAKGVHNSYEIASASKSVVAMSMGLEDYTADIGVQRTKEGRESIFARQFVINSARAVGIQVLDTVFSDVNDMEGLEKSVLEAKSLGFDGKGCIHPRQIRVVNNGFAPSETEIEKAKKIVLAYEEAKEKGLGVIALNSKMIDVPVVKRAIRTVDLAVKTGILSKSWRDEGE